MKSVPISHLKTSNMALAMVSSWNDFIDRSAGRLVFYCGNCNKRIVFNATSEPLRVCIKCGEEFDWRGSNRIDKKEYKICPICKRGFPTDAEFCGYCVPAVKLENG
jgi:hypothetical protein